ncbi:endonuclease III [Urbifossiella limnaea]|uniref:Endonuclease III n=1 Tax=Urbifossiella limnaea TaxID=2528023 RepID=A0A517XP13_9BACT|nr:endonuclease III [Urbifossiella limnaea]QDU19250.1 Ultraviolet N-glycosylase/AP lyase [Urbifossiella limnaea]
MTDPKLPPRAERVAAVLALLDALYPAPETALDHQNPLQLLVATILSAQCTDKRVNLVTPALFARYHTAADYADAEPAELEEYVKTTGFFRSKAKNIRACCRLIVDRHGGEVPGTLEELVELPGVGRKTANVVLGNAFDTPGITVDTHVGRLSRRLGWTRHTDPVKVERVLMKLWPRERWTLASHQLILHGRAVCHARKPRCEECAVSALCPRVGVSGSRWESPGVEE